LLLPKIHLAHVVIDKVINRAPEEERNNLFLPVHRSKCDLTFSLGLLLTKLSAVYWKTSKFADT